MCVNRNLVYLCVRVCVCTLQTALKVHGSGPADKLQVCDSPISYTGITVGFTHNALLKTLRALLENIACGLFLNRNWVTPTHTLFHGRDFPLT